MSLIIEDSKKIKYKKFEQKLYSFGNNNIINIVQHRNNSNQKIFNGLNNDKTPNKTNIIKNRISPYKNHFNKSLSSLLLNQKNNLKKSKKYYIKSPLSFFNNINPTPSQNKDQNKNIFLIPININQNNNNKNNKNNNINNKPNNNQRSVEYNTINCIINNFNLSYKNFDSHLDKKTNSVKKNAKFYDYDIFNKNNNKLNQLNNFKKNNSMSNIINNIKNISNISENNISNINNLTNLNDESKIEDIIFENNQKKLKIEERNQDNTKKLIFLKELERKNKKLKIEYEEIKIKNMEYAKSLERLFKFLKVLKNSGLDISEMMENISSGEDYDEFDEDNELEKNSDNKKNKKNKKKDSKSESQMTEGSVPISNVHQLSSGLLRNHEEFSKGSKLNLNFKNNIPSLNIGKIKKNYE